MAGGIAIRTADGLVALCQENDSMLLSIGFERPVRGVSTHISGGCRLRAAPTSQTELVRPCQYSSRRTRLSSLPESVRGNESRSSYARGRL
jgi:hypothetical protein